MLAKEASIVSFIQAVRAHFPGAVFKEVRMTLAGVACSVDMSFFPDQEQIDSIERYIAKKGETRGIFLKKTMIAENAQEYLKSKKEHDILSMFQGIELVNLIHFENRYFPAFCEESSSMEQLYGITIYKIHRDTEGVCHFHLMVSSTAEEYKAHKKLAKTYEQSHHVPIAKKHDLFFYSEELNEWVWTRKGAELKQNILDQWSDLLKKEKFELFHLNSSKNNKELQTLFHTKERWAITCAQHHSTGEELMDGLYSTKQALRDVFFIRSSAKSSDDTGIYCLQLIEDFITLFRIKGCWVCVSGVNKRDCLKNIAKTRGMKIQEGSQNMLQFNYIDHLLCHRKGPFIYKNQHGFFCSLMGTQEALIAAMLQQGKYEHKAVIS